MPVTWHSPQGHAQLGSWLPPERGLREREAERGYGRWKPQLPGNLGSAASAGLFIRSEPICSAHIQERGLHGKKSLEIRIIGVILEAACHKEVKRILFSVN